jgi:TrmH family RNA methyltransferase
VQRLRRLSGRRAARLEEGAFVIDGPVLVQDALAAGVSIQEAFATADADADAVRALMAAGVDVHEVRAEVLARAVDTVTPHGLAAIATRVEVPLADAVEAAAAGPVALVLVDVQDPGNAGTLLRTAEASGAAAVIFCGTSVDPVNAKCVRGSAGALFHVPVAAAGDAVAVIEQLRARGVRTAATVVREGTAYDRADLRDPIAFVLGSEAHGLPAVVVGAVSERLTIPMEGRSESLNVAMAGAVLCFEALRQRRTDPEPIGEAPA